MSTMNLQGGLVPPVPPTPTPPGLAYVVFGCENYMEVFLMYLIVNLSHLCFLEVGSQ